MNRSVVWTACAFLCGSFGAAQPDEAVLQIQEADLHALIRETAGKVEEKFKGVHAEADGLIQFVDEALAAPAPPKAAEGDRNQQRAAALQLMSLTTKANATLASARGFVFDSSHAGYAQHYQELEKDTRVDGEEVLRWLEMRHAAKNLEWPDKEQQCDQRALGAARAFVAREPKNAQAHALLAETLRWEDADETLKALQTALELDPKHPRALQLLLARRTQKALESAALRRESGLEEKLPHEAERLLYDKALSEEEMLTFGKRQDELRREAEDLLKLARERRDLAVYLTALEGLSTLQRHAQMAKLASQRADDVSYEDFRQQTLQLNVQLMFTLFSQEEFLREALRLAVDDPEATGAIMLIALTGDAMAAFATGRPLSAVRMAVVDETTTRLVEMAGADAGLKAARASEAACIIQWIGLLMGHKPPHPEMILRTLRLDPFRHRTQGLLLALCAQKQDLRAARALAQIQLALVPSHETRRVASALATRMHDWPAAHKLLDACLKDKPGDISLLSQRAATLLRENQSKATQRKAAALYDKIEALLQDEEARPTEDDHEILTWNRVLFLGICGKREEEEDSLAAAVKDRILSEESGKELEQWLR